MSRIEAITGRFQEKEVEPDINLDNRCSCGALMILYDSSDKNCRGYKCPVCGSMKFSYKKAS